MSVNERIVINAYSGGGVFLNEGDTVRVINTEGQQIADMWALEADDFQEYLCTSNTRSLNYKLFPAVGEEFYSKKFKPMLKFLADKSPGIHDTLHAACTEAFYCSYGLPAGHDNCDNNFLTVCKEMGIDRRETPMPVNLFQNTPVDGKGNMSAGTAPAKAGDYVEFKALMPLAFIVSSCSFDMEPYINGKTCTPLALEITRAA